MVVVSYGLLAVGVIGSTKEYKTSIFLGSTAIEG